MTHAHVELPAGLVPPEGKTIELVYPATEMVLREIIKLREQCSSITPGGASLLKPLEPSELWALLPTTLTAWQDDALVGTAYWQSLGDRPDTAMIGGIAVDEQSRRNGICPQMVARLLQECREEGILWAISITAHPGLQRYYANNSWQKAEAGSPWQAQLNISRARYAQTGEAHLPELYVFDLDAA